jgi:hypothetical protein
MTQLSYRQLLAFLLHHPHPDIADIGGDPTLEVGDLSQHMKRTIYNITDGLDICATPLPRMHETILCLDLFEHIVDPIRAAENIVKSLTGWLFVTTLFVFHKHDYPVDMYRFTDTAMSWLFRELDIERCWFEPEGESSIPGGTRVSIIARKKPS